MTKAEQIVKNLQDKGIHTYNLSEQVDILSAMEEQAVKFIEWRENTPNVRRVGIDKWFYNGEYYTSKELYKLFNEL